MAIAGTPTPTLIAVDANFIIGFCAKEPDKHPVVRAELIRFANDGAQVYAPGVLISEALYVFCKKLRDGHLTATEYTAAVQSLDVIMSVIAAPPRGDASLIVRAEQIRHGRSCRRTTDAIYIALAEELTSRGAAELVTFDPGLRTQAIAEAPTVTVRLLVPSPPASPPAAGPPALGSSTPPATP
jgi:predicted nucleic acid-binding protein